MDCSLSHEKKPGTGEVFHPPCSSRPWRVHVVLCDADGADSHTGQAPAPAGTLTTDGGLNNRNFSLPVLEAQDQGVGRAGSS